MVTRRLKHSLPLLYVDIIGGLATAACVAGFLWMAFVHSDRTSSTTATLRVACDHAEQNLGQLTREKNDKRAQLEERQSLLDRSGRLPERTPIEPYFQTLSQLTARHHLRILSQSPLASRTYLGLLEQRYAFEISGAMPDLASFLQSVEATEFWADVSYMSITSRPSMTPDAPAERIARLTLSLFSSASTEATLKDG